MYSQNTKLRKRASTCLIKSNITIKYLLARRFNELGLTYDDIVNNAKEDGFHINKSTLSRYFTHKNREDHHLTQENILYLCAKYGIMVELDVRIKPFNEEVSKRDVLIFKELIKYR